MSKKQGRTGDEETDEILDEMEADGIDVSGIGDKEVEVEETSTGTDPELEESEEESEESKGEESDDAEDSGEESEEEDDGDESDEEDDAGDDEDDGEDAEGKGKKLTLVQKYRKEKKLRRETQEALANALSAKSDEAFDTEVQKFATANKMNVEVARGLIELAAKRAGLPKDVMEDIQRSRTERRDREYWKGQRTQFKKDFVATVRPMLTQLGKKDADIESVFKTLDSDEKSPTWAWSKANKEKSLVQLALAAIRTTGTRVSSETGGRRVRTQSGKAPEEMTGDDINEMSDEEFDSFSDKLGKGSRSVVHRSS